MGESWSVCLPWFRDLQALVQEGQLAQPLRQNVVAVVDLLEDFLVGVKGQLGAGFLSLAGDLEFSGRVAALVGLLPHLAVAPDLQIQPVRQCVDHRDAHTVQSARNLVALVIELAARVEHRHHHLGSGLLLGRVHVHGNAPTVVHYGDAVVFVHFDVDLVAIARQGLVHRVVYDFPDQVVQSLLAGRADVHRRALAHRFQVAQYLDRGGVVPVPRAFADHRLFLAHVVHFSLRAWEGRLSRKRLP